MKTASIWGCFLLLFAIVSPASPNTLQSQSQAATHNQAVEFNNRGLELYKAGKIDEAIKQFRQALAIDPNFPEADSNLGLALDAKGEVDEAIVDFNKALALKPTDAITESNLGLALFHKGKLDESLAAYRKALEFQPNFPQAYNGMGVVLFTQGYARRHRGLSQSYRPRTKLC